jgi:hypothetical protein
LIDPKHIRVGNLILTSKEENQEPFLRSVVKEIRKDHVIVDGERSVYFKDCAPMPITLELLKGCGFEISDLGDFWECRKADFILIQMKLQIVPGHKMPFMFAIKSSLEEAVLFTDIHHLQNTYFDLKQEELQWKH